MAEISFQVSSYEVSHQVGVYTIGGQNYPNLALIRCTGVLDRIPRSLFIAFMPDGQDLPPNYVEVRSDGSWVGWQFRHAAHYAWFVDLLRNEHPIYAMLSQERPHLNFMSTSSEPVGEGERDAP